MWDKGIGEYGNSFDASLLEPYNHDWEPGDYHWDDNDHHDSLMKRYLIYG